MTGKETLARYNVFATFPDMEAARGALDALGAGGTEAGDVSLRGRVVDEAAEKEDTADRDSRVISRLARGVLKGAAIGGAAGAVGGLLVAVVSGFGQAVGLGLLVGALIGSTVGGLIGGVATIDLSEGWELTFESVHPGRIVVGVHSDRPDEVRRAEEILRKRDPIEIHGFDSGTHSSRQEELSRWGRVGVGETSTRR